jgi:hypothetical protein
MSENDFKFGWWLLLTFLGNTVTPTPYCPFLVHSSICARTWFVKELLMTKLGWPWAQPRFTRRPSATWNHFLTCIAVTTFLCVFLDFYRFLLSSYLSLKVSPIVPRELRPSWLWSYGGRIYNYLCNRFLSPLTLRVRTPFMARCTRYNIMW